MSYVPQIAVAMGSTLYFAKAEKNLQEAYETVAGGGCCEIYGDLASYAKVLGEMLDEIVLLDTDVSWPGVVDYEVAEPFAIEWQQMVMRKAELLAEGAPVHMADVISMHCLGEMTFKFFTQRSNGTTYEDLNVGYADKLAEIVLRHTGWRQA